MQTISRDLKTGAPFLLLPSALTLPGAPAGKRSATVSGAENEQDAHVSPCARPYRNCGARSVSLCLNRGCRSMSGLSGSEPDPIVVEAAENSVGNVRSVPTFLSTGVMCCLCAGETGYSFSSSNVSPDEHACRSGDGGRQVVHSSGRTCVHSTDFGPWVSQKCVKESCTKRCEQAHAQTIVGTIQLVVEWSI